MPEAPYTGPETETSVRVLRELAPGLPEPVMLLGGWGVYFTVRDVWLQVFGEEYFGSRDIDLGFHTPPDAALSDLQTGNMPATLRFLETRGFTRQGMYQVVRYHDWETHEVIPADRIRTLAGFQYYDITVDLIASHQRDDLRDVAGFQAFSEPLLEVAFSDELHRRSIDLDGHEVWVPAPHVLVATKLKSLPERQKDHKSIKDVCDLYALITASGVGARTLRSRVHRILPDASTFLEKARASPHLEASARHLEIDPAALQTAIGQLG